MIRRITDTDAFTGRAQDHKSSSNSFSPPPMHNNRSKTVLIVEDEQDVIDLLAVRLLKDTTYTISTASDGLSGLEKARTELPWIIILDLMLPKMSGLEVCRILKSDRVTGEIPIIILSARATEADRLAGLELGADDYVTKPFSPREVVLRMQAIERRRSEKIEDAILVSGPITLDARTMKVTVNGTLVKLTSHEFRVLSYLMHHPGKVVSHNELTEHIYAQGFDRDSNTLEVFIARLRRKLGVTAIETVRGLGYRMETDS